MTRVNLEKILKKIPHLPGVYKMKDSAGKFIYVGKAKDLSKRVRSYFQKQKDVPLRTQKMLSQIADIDWIEVGSDLEAILLETNLIKEFMPKYNVLMKDDKNFVYIKITKEDFPRIQIVRKVLNDGAKYFGPKTAAHKVEKTLDVLQKIFNYRSCNLGINWVNIGEVKISNKVIAYPCLDYHIKRCEAPCIAKISPDRYLKNIEQIQNFLEGKTAEIENALNLKMQDFVKNKNFEMAAKIRDKLAAIADLMQKQIISSPEHKNSDVIAFVVENQKAYFNLFMIRDGKLLNQENFLLEAPSFETGDENDAVDIIESFLFDYYSKALQFPSEILIPLELYDDSIFPDYINNLADKKVKIIIPERGRKHSLLELSKKNAESFKKQHIIKWELSSKDEARGLMELKDFLSLRKIPKRIECYDISHLGGTGTVASMVVFENAFSSKADYRKFRLQSLKSGEIDDFKSMAEVLLRRLSYISKGPKGLKFKKKADVFIATDRSKKILGRFNVKIKNSFAFIDEYSKTDLTLFRFFLKYIVEKTKVKRIYICAFLEDRDFFENVGFSEIKILPDDFTNKSAKDIYFVFDKFKNTDSSFVKKPDLILIDGGKGQLSAVLKVKEGLGLKIPCISLAKREEEVFVENNSIPIAIPKNSEALNLLRRIRDEAHRFAITFQKTTRKEDFKSILNEIEGVGESIKMKLLKHFSSLEMIKNASVEEVAVLTGIKLAERILAHLTK